MERKRASQGSQQIDTLSTIDRAISEFIQKENRYLSDNNLEEHVTEETQFISNIFKRKTKPKSSFMDHFIVWPTKKKKEL